jgi:hypothetical protein
MPRPIAILVCRQPRALCGSAQIECWQTTPSYLQKLSNIKTVFWMTRGSHLRGSAATDESRRGRRARSRDAQSRYAIGVAHEIGASPHPAIPAAPMPACQPRMPGWLNGQMKGFMRMPLRAVSRLCIRRGRLCAAAPVPTADRPV